ncbi:MAG: hypothetical protein IKO99_03595 [Bacteroidales bacterium]|nr:hypothetical protein [Alphaproteobacteria bacterium]MBR4677068.1 hypothetical protein [Bacteroidales bacterium]
MNTNKRNRIIALILFLICLFNSTLNAQIKDSPVLFYTKDTWNHVEIIQFRNFQWFQIYTDNEKEKVIRNLKRNINYYEELIASGSVKPRETKAQLNLGLGELKYRPDMSNESWYVYSQWNTGYSQVPERTYYDAFKKDFSEKLFWFEPIIGEPSKVSRVTKQELLETKAVRPFLK